MSSIHLNVNIDHFATLREARKGHEPDVLQGALSAVRAGAKGIVCHLREDRRHIHDKDIFVIKENINAKFDLEMANTPEMISIALKLKPDLVTIVPEKREELTTEGGLNVFGNKSSLIELTKIMHDNGIEVSFFLEPNLDHIKYSMEMGIDMVEIHTGNYANLFGLIGETNELNKINESIDFLKSQNLQIAVGHGLNYQNITNLAKNKNIDEFSIGHSIVANSLFWGISEATSKMVGLIEKARH
jgi:pyridoxine 5-phosphate synthase